jgi:hypothetical protein
MPIKTKPTKPTGFAAMRRDKLLLAAARGGRQAHKLKKAHRWTVREARDAGRKGGLRRALNARQQRERR